MKRFLILLISIAFLQSCKNEASNTGNNSNEYIVNAKVTGFPNGMRAMIRDYDNPRRQVAIDTAILLDNNYVFKGSVKSPKMCILTVNGLQGGFPFVLENGNNVITVDMNNIRNSSISGTVNNQVYNDYTKGIKQKEANLREFNKQLRLKETSANAEAHEFEKIQKQIKTAKAELESFPFEFITENANADYSLMLLNLLVAQKKGTAQNYKTALNALKNVVNKNENTKEIGNRVEEKIKQLEAGKNVAIGKKAPNFSAKTPEGKDLALNDVKGKLTLIDFWASWCGPCRRENPNVVKVYNKYHKKGLEIISVSLDRQGQEARWKKAIQDDKMDWHHISNLKYWQDPIAKTYGVKSIPATFLLDANGKIIAKNLRGQKLEQKIAEILK